MAALPTFQELVNLYADRRELNQADFLTDLKVRHRILADQVLHSDFPTAQ
jgi:hypothetical protein